MDDTFVYFTSYVLDDIEHEISVRYEMQWPEPDVNFHGGPIDADFTMADGAPVPDGLLAAMQSDRPWMDNLQCYLSEHANETAAERAAFWMEASRG